MRDLFGYFLIAQAIFIGIIVYSIQQLSDSINASASYIATKSEQLSWGTDFGMPLFVLLLLIGVAVLGLFLLVRKK